MTEREFWTALEFRVCSEIQSFQDNRLRFLFCDGFIPDDEQPDPGVIVGQVFISEDDGRTFPDYRFRLLIPTVERDGQRPRWKAMVPPESVHGWLSINREEKWIEIRPERKAAMKR
jgi:hypothetical protein